MAQWLRTAERRSKIGFFGLRLGKAWSCGPTGDDGFDRFPVRTGRNLVMVEIVQPRMDAWGCGVCCWQSACLPPDVWECRLPIRSTRHGLTTTRWRNRRWLWSGFPIAGIAHAVLVSLLGCTIGLLAAIKLKSGRHSTPLRYRVRKRTISGNHWICRRRFRTQPKVLR